MFFALVNQHTARGAAAFQSGIGFRNDETLSHPRIQRIPNDECGERGRLRMNSSRSSFTDVASAVLAEKRNHHATVIDGSHREHYSAPSETNS